MTCTDENLKHLSTFILCLYKVRKTCLQVEYHNIVINVSPIDRGHCLIVPYPKLTLPQVRKCAINKTFYC